MIESTINNYSGVSSDTKPLRSTGTNVPNGSRFREDDTKKIFHYNESDDKWYLTSDTATLLEFGDGFITAISDIQTQDLLKEILTIRLAFNYY